MMCKIGVHLITIITLLVTTCSAQLDTNPVDNDPRILKQPPHHWGTPAPDSDIKLDFVPFKVLASVRREQSTKHLPREAALAQASTPEEIILAKRLRESITTKKLAEVYTEQGYEDKKYDHGFHEKQGDFKEKYEKFDKGKVTSKKPVINHSDDDGDDDHNISSSNKQELPVYYPRSYPKFKHHSTNTKETNIKPTNKPKLISNHNYDKVKYPYYKTAPKNSPQRYATNIELIPKKGASEMPFYDSTNYKECPEISPNIKIGPDVESNKGEPRLKGLGDKIDCLKSKYFGVDPFDNPFFKEDSVEEIEGLDNIASKLLPSESNSEPILFIANSSKESRQVNKKDQISRPSSSKKKFHNGEKSVVISPKRQSTTEYIVGMLPPPAPNHRYKRELTSRQVYSTRRGGVKFASTDLDGDGSDIDVASIVTSHRVSPDSKYGVRDSESRRSPATSQSDAPAPRGRESRTRSRHYEVTELPEEPLSNNRFSNRGSSRRTSGSNNNNNNEKITKEKVYSSTYVPRTNNDEELSPEVTTNAVVPEVTLRYKIDSENYNTETQQREIVTESPYKPEHIAPTTSRAHDSGRSRTRSRPPVALISEDVFQGRGERRKTETPPKTNSELLRSRNRSTKVKNVENARTIIENTTPEPFLPEILTQEPDAFIIPTENIPVINHVPTESFEIPITEKIPIERHTSRQRPAEISRNPLDKTPSERKQHIERQSRPERKQRVRTESTNIEESEVSSTPRVIASRDRSSSRRQEAFKSKKQDYTANINFEPSRHSRTRINTRPSIDPVDNVEQLSDTRRVNRQGSRRNLDSTSRAEQPQQQQVESAPSRRTTRRRVASEPAAATSASSTRYQFPGNQQTTLYQDDSGRRYLCIVLEDDVNVDKVVINTKVK